MSEDNTTAKERALARGEEWLREFRTLPVDEQIEHTARMIYGHLHMEMGSFDWDELPEWQRSEYRGVAKLVRKMFNAST